jgi:hypothetical protein
LSFKKVIIAMVKLDTVSQHQTSIDDEWIKVFNWLIGLEYQRSFQELLVANCTWETDT